MIYVMTNHREEEGNHFYDLAAAGVVFAERKSFLQIKEMFLSVSRRGDSLVDNEGRELSHSEMKFRQLAWNLYTRGKIDTYTLEEILEAAQ